MPDLTVVKLKPRKASPRPLIPTPVAVVRARAG